MIIVRPIALVWCVSCCLAWAIFDRHGIAASQSAAKQADLAGPKFPMQEFSPKAETALWLVRYDAAAWKSSDIVLAAPEAELKRLGPEWFCVEADARWDCFYGRYDSVADRYDVVFHLRSGKGADFTRVQGMVAPPDVVVYARALSHNMNVVPPEIRDSQLRFNTYVRKVGERIEVWTLPAQQLDRRLVFGGDLRQTFDATGAKLLETAFTTNGFRVGRGNPQTDLRIDNEANETPTVGQLFFLLTCRDQFKSVSVVNRRFITSFVDVDGKMSWLNAERH